MSDLMRASRDAARAIARMNGSGRTNGSDQRGMAWGTVVSVKNQFVDVMIGGTVSGSLRYTTACDGMAEGDRVMVQYVGHEPVVVGVMARSSKAGKLSLIDVTAVNDAYPPKYRISGGVLMLSGRVKNSSLNARVADLSTFIEKSAIPPTGVNRSFPCVMLSSGDTSKTANVFLDSSGMLLVAQADHDWVDLSGVVIAASS